MGVSCHPSFAGILSGVWRKNIPMRWAEATPKQTNSVRTADPVRGREKPKEIIIGFFNQGRLFTVYRGRSVFSQ